MKTHITTPTLKTGLLLALACAAFPPADAQQQEQQGQQSPQGGQEDFSQALRELNIMSNIFAATLEEDRDNRFPSFGRSPDALYLAGQGMVFTFNLNNAMFPADIGGYFRQFGADMQRIADDVMNEISASFPDVDFDFDFNYDLDYDDDNGGVVFVPPAPAPAPPGGGPFVVNLREARNEQREAMQEMMEEMRDQQREVQELQRDLRELQRDLRDRDGNVASIEEEIRQIEAAVTEETATLETQRQAYQRFVEEYEVRRREQVENLNRELTTQVVTTLCDYGATLRSLEDGEHVTLIFENFSEDEDQVYVFDYQDLSACDSADSLLASAVGYRIPN